MIDREKDYVLGWLLAAISQDGHDRRAKVCLPLHGVREGVRT
jgi:hypothetical protein